MIDAKIRDYVDLLKRLYGNSMYVQKILSSTLTEEEHRFVKRLLNEYQSSRSLVFIRHPTNSNASDKAKYRLFKKLDSLILAFPPSSTLPKRVELRRDAYSNLTAGVLAISSGLGLHSMAKHKFQHVLRAARIPELVELRMIAIEYLMRIASYEANFIEYKKLNAMYSNIYEQAVTIRTLNRLLTSLILANSRMVSRTKHLKRISDEAVPIIEKINLSEASPDVVISGCPLATAVGQITGDYEMASRWLTAYRKACIAIRAWDDSHQRDWLLQQITLNEYFRRKRDMAKYIHRLLELSEHGSVRWFEFSNLMCHRALKNGDYKTARELASAVIFNVRFRKQMKSNSRSMLILAGYAAVLSWDDVLEKTYRRRIPFYEVEKLHVLVIDMISAIRSWRFDLAIDHCVNLQHNLAGESALTKNQKTLKKHIFRVLKTLKLLSQELSYQKTKVLASELLQYFSSNIIPVTLEMI